MYLLYFDNGIRGNENSVCKVAERSTLHSHIWMVYMAKNLASA